MSISANILVTKVVKVRLPGVQGATGPQNLFVQPTQPVFSGPYLWLQTGLPGGGYTLWAETGV